MSWVEPAEEEEELDRESDFLASVRVANTKVHERYQRHCGRQTRRGPYSRTRRRCRR